MRVPTPEVSVVVVTHDSRSVLEECLASLAPGLEGVGDWELVVVDSGSTDGSPEVARRLTRPLAAPSRVVELPGNLGFAAGVNAGLAAARRSAAVLLLNPDARLHRGAVAALRSTLAVPGVGIAAPLLLDADGEPQASLWRSPTTARTIVGAVVGGRAAARLGRLGESIDPHRGPVCPSEVAWATGAALLVSRDCLDAVGPWDESWFLYSEEADVCLRARDLGYRVGYQPSARVTHLGGESGTSPELWSLLTANRVRFHRARAGRRAGEIAYWSAVGHEAAAALAGRPRSRAAVAALARHRRQLLDGEGTPDALVEAARGRAAASSPAWICFSAQDWWYHNRAHSDFQLMLELARDRDVLVVNSIGLRMPLPGRSTQPLRRVARKAASTLRFVRSPRPDRPRFHVMTPLSLPVHGSDRAGRANAALVRAQVRFVSRALGLRGPGRPAPSILVTLPTAWEVVRPMPRSTLAVNRSDRFSAFGEADGARIHQLEVELLRRADLVVYASRALLAAEAEHTGRRALLLGHGVDPVRFDPARYQGVGTATEPPDLAAIPHPRAGFFGGLDDYLVDFDLLRTVAEALPEVQLVLIGDATCSLAALTALPNVHHLGHRPHEQIPAYGVGFDVALMPWLDNEWIRSSNPIKLLEYLALGLPIVSTDFPEAHHHGELLRIARSSDEFVELVAATVADGGPATPSQRRRAAVEQTWERCATRLAVAAEAPAPVPVPVGGRS